jgi:SAM-dependent methyltransferase
MPEATPHNYEDRFFDYIEAGARRSAQHIIAFLRLHLHVASVLDVGCGRGVWVDEWRRSGVEDAVGADGTYVSTDRLLIPKEQFVVLDLSQTFCLDRRFDLVQSLEVAEHIPVSQAEVFVDNLIAHSDVILFSAAVPGQGGEFHVNEQSYEYWREAFARRGFEVFDCVRPNIARIGAISPWYRYNTFLYARGSALDRIPEEFRRMQLRRDEPITDLAPLVWRLRNLTFRYLPQPLVQRIARFKHAVVRSGLLPG